MKQKLIDANKLSGSMYHEAFETDTDMQKWDSGCWIRYKMFEKQLEAQPIVEAIPIEWLKNELIPKAEKLGATEYVNNVRFVLEDWETWKRYYG